MKTTIKYGEKEANFEVRKKVFVEEQGFQNEFDDIDEFAEFITLYVDQKLAGCTRCYFKEQSKEAIFGRLAVLPEYRGKGLGQLLVQVSEERMKELGAISMHLHAQCYIKNLYEKLGYISYGDIELDEHVEHIWMKKDFK